MLAQPPLIQIFISLETESIHDYLAFEISHDGVTFQELARWSGSAVSWQFKDIYYNNYVGDSSVWVAWRFYSDSTVTYDGAWVDDIRIWKFVPAATPTRTLSPTITKTKTKSATPTITKTRTKSPTPTISPTRTKSATVTKTRTPTKTSTRTITPTPTKSATRTKTATITKTFTPKPTRTRTKTATRCSICTSTPTKTRTKTLTPTQTKTRTPSITPTKTLTPTPTGYRRYDAANYADTWAHGRNPDYPLMSTVGRETGCKCDNCTNFASQVLHAGGRDYTGDYLNHGQDVKDWWFDLSNTNLTSPITWRYVESFKTYAEQYPNEFDVSLSLTTDPNLPANIRAGDFILLDLGDNVTGENIPDDRPDHVRVVVGEGWTSTNIIDYYAECENSTPAPTPSAVPTSILKMLIDQHCVDRYHVAWNYGILDDANKWYIHVK